MEAKNLDVITVEILKNFIELEQGECFVVSLPQIESGDDEASAGSSTLQLFEDGLPLGPGHSMHDAIREKGAGSFSHWGDALYFSSSDGTDPRTSDHQYSVKSTRRSGYVQHPSVFRGFEVVPAFMDGQILSQSLIDDVDQHAEAPGKSSWGTRNILQAFILSMRPKTVLEIGAHIGSASIVIGAALKANGSGVLFALEPQEHYFEILNNFIRKAQLTDVIRTLKLYSTSEELLDLLPPMIEMIFLDANHAYSAASHDFRLCDRLLATNGMLFVDDVGPAISPQLDPEGRGGVRQALLDFTQGRPDLHTIFLEPPMWLSACGMAVVCKQTIQSRNG